jgi:uncharacterized protein
MPTEKADIYTLAKFGDLASFISNFDQNLLNEKSSSGSGLLHYAISGNRFDIASFLIDQGIDVNMTNADGQTALHLVCVKPGFNCCKITDGKRDRRKLMDGCI